MEFFILTVIFIVLGDLLTFRFGINPAGHPQKNCKLNLLILLVTYCLCMFCLILFKIK